jgi:hypothetical protein
MCQLAQVAKPVLDVLPGRQECLVPIMLPGLEAAARFKTNTTVESVVLGR